MAKNKKGPQQPRMGIDRNRTMAAVLGISAVALGAVVTVAALCVIMRPSRQGGETMASRKPLGRPAQPMPPRIDASPEEIAEVVLGVPYKEIAPYLEQVKKQDSGREAAS